MPWDEGLMWPLSTPLPYVFVWAEISFCRAAEPFQTHALLQVPVREGHITPLQAMEPSRGVWKTSMLGGFDYLCPQIRLVLKLCPIKISKN